MTGIVNKIQRFQLKVVQKSCAGVPKTIAAGAMDHLDCDIRESGWTPLGVVGMVGSGTTPFTYADVYLDSGNIAKIYMTNFTSSAKTLNNLRLNILYYKTN